MHGYLKNRISFRLLLIFITVLLTSTLISQNEISKKVVNQDGDTIVLKAISLSSITQNTDLVYKLINKISEESKPNSRIMETDSLFKQAVEKIRKEKEIITKNKSSSNRILDDAYQQWTNYKNKLKDWLILITDYSKVLDNNITKTENLITVWELTLNEAKREKVPEGIILNIQGVLNKLNSLRANLKTKILDIYSMQSKITDLGLYIDETLQNIEIQKTNLQKNYLKQDSPTIWNVSDSSFLSISNSQIPTIIVDETSKAVRVFTEANKDRFAIHILLFLLLTLLFYFLSKYAIQEDTDNNLVSYSKKVIQHYVLSALIISLISTIWIYPTRQLVVDDIFQLILIILVLIFAQKVSSHKIKIVLYYAIVMHITNQLQTLLPSNLLISRILIFIEIGLSFVIFRFLLQKNGILYKKIHQTKWEFIIFIIKIFYAALLIPLFANIFGFLGLATLFNNIIVNSIVNGIIASAGLFIIINALKLLFRTPQVLLLNSINKNRDFLIKKTSKYAIILVILLWLKSVLLLFGIYENVKEWIGNLFLISWKAGGVQIDVGSVLSFLLVILITYFITKFIKIILEEEIFTRVKLPRGVPGAISMVIRYFIVGWGIIISINALGVDLSQFGLIAGALGVGIGFGLQNVVFNFIAGLILAFERPIQIGDTIETSTVMGNVKSIGVRSSTILTFEGSEVIVPNGNLISNDVINWTLSDRRKRRDIFVGVEYGSDPHKVMEILRQAADKNINVLQNPEPWILFDGFGASSLDFRLRIWTSLDVGLTTKSEVTIAIYDGLKAAKINIPFPQQDLHLKSIEPEIEKIILKKDETKRENS